MKRDISMFFILISMVLKILLKEPKESI